MTGPVVDLVARLASAIEDLPDGRCVLVALDGRSGAGKSTLARTAARTLGCAVVDGDDFYAGGTAATWDALDAPGRVERCIDWRRQRGVLDALASGRVASWYPYDWDADDGRLSDRPLECRPAPVVILDGAYSARPELADLLDLRVLLDTPVEVRRRQLLEREGADYRAEWEARWSEAEDWYFSHVMPPSAFDLVLAPAT